MSPSALLCGTMYDRLTDITNREDCWRIGRSQKSVATRRKKLKLKMTTKLCQIKVGIAFFFWFVCFFRKKLSRSYNMRERQSKIQNEF